MEGGRSPPFHLGDDLEMDLALPLLLDPPLHGKGRASRLSLGRVTSEAIALLKLSWPLMAEEVVSYATVTVGMLAVGRLGRSALASAALARSAINITGNAYLVGVTSPVDTHVSAAHGARSHALVGECLQRAILFTLVAATPLVVLYCTLMHPLLHRLSSNPALAANAARYVMLQSPWALTHGVGLVLYRGLIAQGGVFYVLGAGAVTLATALLSNWLLIFKLGLGLDGAALAMVASDAVYLLALTFATWLHNRHQRQFAGGRPWGRGFTRQALYGWAHYAQLAAASTAMVMMDWAVYDIAVLLSGMLPHVDADVAAMGVASQVSCVLLVLNFGVGLAAAARVGNLLGGGLPDAAKLAAGVAGCLGVALMTPVAGALVVAGSRTALLFSRDAEVRQAFGRLVVPLAVAVACPANVLSGVLRGCGRQQYGAFINLFSNWAVGLTLQLVLTFHFSWGIEGLWWALATTGLVQSAAMAIVVGCVNWHGERQRSQQMLRHLSSSSIAASCATPSALATPHASDGIWSPLSMSFSE